MSIALALRIAKIVVPILLIVGLYFLGRHHGYNKHEMETLAAQAKVNSISREITDMLQDQSNLWSDANYRDLTTWGVQTKETTKYVKDIVYRSPAYRPDCVRDERVLEQNNRDRAAFNARNARPPEGSVSQPFP